MCLLRAALSLTAYSCVGVYIFEYARHIKLHSWIGLTVNIFQLTIEHTILRVTSISETAVRSDGQ